MKAVILAAGKGKRLKPLTDEKHKVMLPIGNRPMLEYTIETLSKNGIKEIFIVINQRKEDIMDHFKDGSDFSVSIKYLNQKNPKGTADAVRYAEDNIDESFILLNGDVFFHPSILESLLEESKNADGVIVAKEVSNPEHYGSLQIEDGKITKIIEKSQNPPSNIVNQGLYYLPRDIFEAIEETPLSERGEYELTDSLEILIKKGLVIRPLIVKDFCIDIGRMEDYEKAKEAFSQWKNER
ncbi:MAG: sugar phosphate nucleotidyltransferase [Nanoarchaeota archaeon]